MKLTKEEEQFFAMNKEFIKKPIQREIDRLINVMLVNPDERDRAADMIKKLKELLVDFKVTIPEDPKEKGNSDFV